MREKSILTSRGEPLGRQKQLHSTKSCTSISSFLSLSLSLSCTYINSIVLTYFRDKRKKHRNRRSILKCHNCYLKALGTVNREILSVSARSAAVDTHFQAKTLPLIEDLENLYRLTTSSSSS